MNRMISCAGCERDVVRKCGRELIRELSVDRSMGEKESAEFSFGMSVNRRYGREGMRSLLFFFLILLSDFICCELSS